MLVPSAPVIAYPQKSNMMQEPPHNYLSLRGPLSALLFAGLLALVSMLLLNLRQPSPLSEFYLLGSSGEAGGYPDEICPNETIALRLGIANREGSKADYRIEVHFNGRLELQSTPITLEHGSGWQTALDLSLPQMGDNQRIDFFLYLNNSSEPYRKLRLWVSVRENDCPHETP